MRDALFILLLVAAGQGLFLAVFLASQWRKNSANIFLGCLFLFFSLQLFDLVLLSSSRAHDYPHLAFWSAPLNLAFGPLLYLYIRSQAAGARTRLKNLWHLLPFGLHFVYVGWAYHFRSLAYKQQFLDQFLANRLMMDGPPTPSSEVLFTYLIYAQFAVYLWLSKRQLSAPNRYATEKLRLLNRLWWALLVIGVFGLIQLEFYIYDIQSLHISGYIASFIAVLYIYTGALVVFKRPALVFAGQTSVKYQSSNLDEQAALDLMDRVKGHMSQHKPYLDAEFSLKSLSVDLGVSDRHISQVVNERLNKNFSDFVNTYRVNEFKEKLKDPQLNHLSLLGLAMDCGFKSKSTFNTTFKRLTGQTPSAFKQQLEAEK